MKLAIGVGLLKVVVCSKGSSRRPSLLQKIALQHSVEDS